MTIEQKLASLGVVLPAAPSPSANYAPFARSGALLVISGQLPLEANALPARFTGRVGDAVAPETAREAAKVAALACLAQARAALGDLDKVRRVVRLGGFFAPAPGFNALPTIMDGASDLMVAVFGDRGRHARTTVGVYELPRGACVEVEAMFEVEG
jgi:enamine deaminase RidA (YjgF/YER057c/UK114 family)